MKNNYRIKFRKEYFLFLLPLFFVLHGFTENFPLIKQRDGLILLFRYLSASLLLCFVFFLIFKSWRRAAVFAFLAISFYFFFGSIHDTAKSILPKTFLVQYSFIVPLVLALFTALFIYLRKTKREFNRLTQYINLLLCVLITIDFFQLSQKLIERPEKDNSIPAGFVNCDSCKKPDIFFIVADEYAGQQELRDVFHFDNSAFENSLRFHQFHIIDSSTSNYNYTPFSIASTLSMNYLNGLERSNKSKNDRHICYSQINNNDLVSFLKSQGYDFKNHSVFELNNVLPESSSGFILSGKDLLTSQTFLSRLNRDIRFNLITRYKDKSEIERQINKHLNTLDQLFKETKNEASNTSPKPRFIYTHLMMPHYPYLLDKNGQRTNPEMLLEGNQVNQEAFIEYLQYSNSRFLELIETILKKSKKPPIIIFMGDHGFRHFSPDVDHKYYFMNFCSIYLPDKNYDKFYSNMSLVNLFRVLLNSEYNQHLPLLKDSSVFIKN